MNLEVKIHASPMAQVCHTRGRSVRPLAAWYFNDDGHGSGLVDSSGNGHPLSDIGLTFVGGVRGTCAKTGNSVTWPPATPGPITNDSAASFSYSVWIKTATASSIQAIITEGSAGRGFVINGLDNGEIEFNAGAGPIAGHVVVNDDSWHHVVCTFDNSSGISSIYVDGVLDHADNATGGDGGDFSFFGSTDGLIFLDDCYIYDEALTAAQVALLYNAGASADFTVI